MKVFLLLLSLLPIATGIVCRSDYTLINGRICLKYFPTPVTHWVAEQTCKTHAGTLVTAKNAVDNRAIASLANAAGALEIWIGLYSPANSTTYNFWDDYNNTPEGWTNLYNNFMPGNPRVTTGRCSVMEVASSFGANMGKWRSVPCNDQNSPSIQSFPYVCEVPPTYPASPCDVNYNEYCYWRSSKLGTGQGMDITQAAAACAQLGPGYNLVSIHSKIETDFIRLLYRGTNTLFIFIGAQKQTANDYAWLDGTIWDFDYIAPLDFNSRQCLGMDVSPGGYGLWAKTDCAGPWHFLCKKKISPPTIPEKAESPVMAPSFSATINSMCNQTFLAPADFSTYPTYNTPNAYCYWEMYTTGAYQMGIFFNYWATYGTLDVYDEYGNNIVHYSGGGGTTPFPFFPPTNYARITFTPARQAPTSQPDKGFTAVVLPL